MPVSHGTAGGRGARACNQRQAGGGGKAGGYGGTVSREGIPFYLRDHVQNPLEHWAVRDVEAYLLLAETCRGRMDRSLLLQVMNRPARYLARASLETEQVSFGGWKDFYRGKDWICERIDLLQRQLQRLAVMPGFSALHYSGRVWEGASVGRQLSRSVGACGGSGQGDGEYPGTVKENPRAAPGTGACAECEPVRKGCRNLHHAWGEGAGICHRVRAGMLRGGVSLKECRDDGGDRGGTPDFLCGRHQGETEAVPLLECPG